MQSDAENIGLVLEGGGMRGVYTSGVLQAFMENDIYLPYVIGVSMGACNAVNYVSRQPERNKIVNIQFVNDKRYLSYFSLITKGELFGMDFIFNTIPHELSFFDYDTYDKSQQKNITVVTDCKTGEPVYYEKNELGTEFVKVLQASSSLPFVQQPVHYKGRVLFDGGLSDSIPIRKSIADGNKKNIVILTQPIEYRKKPEPFLWLTKIKYPEFKGLYKALLHRHEQYNNTLDFLNDLEQSGSAFVLRPKEKLIVGRVERDKPKLYAVYDQGYKEALEKMEELLKFIDL